MTGPLAGLRIGLLTPWASRLGGGVFEAVVAQTAMIRELGGEPLVFALARQHDAEDAWRFAPTVPVWLPVTGPAHPGYAPGLVAALADAGLDCLHLHSIWLYPSRAATVWARCTGRRYIVSMHGSINPWIVARRRWKKALARLGYERASWRAATVLHALTAAEAQHIASETGRTDALVIPNAAPPLEAVSPRARRPDAAYLGRIHPSKNFGALLAGWRMARLPDGSRLTLAGWGEPGDVSALESMVTQAGPSVRFIGPVYGEAKRDLLTRARFTILPTFSEGLPMTMLESWSAGTPTLMSQASNLPEGFAAGAAIDCGQTPETIARAFEAGLWLDEVRWREMSRAAQALAAGPFSPQVVAAQWASAYLGEVPLPAG